MKSGTTTIARAAYGAAPVALLVAFLVWFGVAQTQATSRYWILVGIDAMVVAVAVIGVNLLLGYTGLLSLGHYAFFIIGGFAGAVWAVEDWGLSPWLGFPVAFVFGLILGTLLALTCCHLHGFYLTVVTLAFGLFASSLALVFDRAFGGSQGRSVTEPLDTNFAFVPASSPNRPYVGLYWVGVAILLLCLYVTWNVVHSKWGRAYRAIREAELAARTCGVPTYACKVSAFALSAGIVSVAGVLAAQTTLQVTMPDGPATVAQSFRFVIDAVFGGLGTLAGPVIGAFTFTFGFGLNFGGRSLNARLGRWDAVFLAAVVLVVTIVMPGGIAGSIARAGAPLRRRLREPPRERDARTPRPRRTLAPGEPLAALHNVSRSFGGVAALQGVDLVVRRGTVHALIGPNGSGKSTLVNVVTGVYPPSGGRVVFVERELTGASPARCSREGIARTFQACQIWRRISLVENVMVGAHTRTHGGLLAAMLLPEWLRPWERRAREQALGTLRFVGLEARARDAAGSLPFTDQRRLEIARALVCDPDLVVLDEPAAGMHPTEIREFVQLVRRIRDAGITVLLVEHHMEVVAELADRVTVLNFGRVIAEGTASEVAADPVVVKAYLGERAHAPRETPVTVNAGTAMQTRSGEGEPRPLLSIRDLNVRYGGALALRGLDLDVGEGEVVALVGANGAGKTTTLKTISGMAELLKAVSGSIVLGGTRIEHLPAHAIARLGVAHVPEGRRVFAESTVEENLVLGAYRRRDAAVKQDIQTLYERFPVLRERRRLPAGLLSGGEQQMLVIARALMSRPRFLLLDEPSLGLSPVVVDELFEQIANLAHEDVTILLVEQLATRALELADRAYVLETGAIVRHGAAGDLVRDPIVRAAFLGEDTPVATPD
jgi:ABC-type branched-subunit amino acid transport system ATPase component/ABC-type branched-subunit amino acid transport system permease subunit